MDPALWIVVIATILSGFFSLISFALRSFSRAKLEDTFSGARGRYWLDLLEKHLKPLRLSFSLCRSVCNLVLVAGLIALSGHLASEQWLDIGLDILLAGVLISIFGVGIPHAWASYGGERILRATMPLLIGVRYLLLPIIAVMHAFDLPVRRLSGAEDEDTENGEAKQEILQAAAEGAAEGSVDAEEVEMIESIMELRDTHAVEIMTPRTDIFALSAGTPLVAASHAITEAGHTRVPIYENDLDHIVGVIYAKDLLRYIGREDVSVSLIDLARAPYFVPETKRLDDLLREFKSRKVHISVVLDEYGGTAGLVTIEDVLEEIVGDIEDEYDTAEEAQYRQISESVIEADGRMHVDEINDLLNLNLPEEDDYDTVAGFIFSVLGYIPKENETFAASGAEFTIVQADERKISRVRLKKLIEEPAE